jgi:hypothetical protein
MGEGQGGGDLGDYFTASGELGRFEGHFSYNFKFQYLKFQTCVCSFCYWNLSFRIYLEFEIWNLDVSSF